MEPNEFEQKLIEQSAQMQCDITYYTFEVPGRSARLALGITSQGVCYVPAVLHPGGQDSAFVQAGLDKIMVAQHSGQLYVPSDWLTHQLGGRPEDVVLLDVISRMEQAVRSAHEDTSH